MITRASDPEEPIYPSLAEGLVPTGPDQLWVADITYIRLCAGFAFPTVKTRSFWTAAVFEHFRSARLSEVGSESASDYRTRTIGGRQTGRFTRTR